MAVKEAKDLKEGDQIVLDNLNVVAAVWDEVVYAGPGYSTRPRYPIVEDVEWATERKISVRVTLRNYIQTLILPDEDELNVV